MYPTVATAVILSAALTVYLSSRAWKIPVFSGQFTLTREIPNISPAERLQLWQSKALFKKHEDDEKLSFENFQDFSSEDLQMQADWIAVDSARSSLDDPTKDLPVLEHVLLVFAARRPDLGYVQGMNLMAGALINLGLSGEEAYYALSYLVDMIAVEYYGPGMVGVKQDMKSLTDAFEACGGVEEPGAVNFIMASLLPSLGAAIFEDTDKLLRLWDAILFFERKGWLAASLALLGANCATKEHISVRTEEITLAVKTADIETALKNAVSALDRFQYFWLCSPFKFDVCSLYSCHCGVDIEESKLRELLYSIMIILEVYTVTLFRYKPEDSPGLFSEEN